MATDERDPIAMALINPVSPEQPGPRTVTIVGSGNVGTAIAYALCLKGLCSDIILYDIDQDKLEAEATDLQIAALYGGIKIHMALSFEETMDSQMCIVTAGARQRPGETRDELLERNVEILSTIIPPLAHFSPNSIMLVVTNPVETLTYLTLRLSGFPPERVIGSGTNLDSARFRLFVSERLGLHPSGVNATVFGQHGDEQITDVSSVGVAGNRFMGLDDENMNASRELLRAAAENAKNSAYTIINSKGFTSWGVAMSVFAICNAILNNTREVLIVSVLIKGCKHAQGRDTYLSMPSMLCKNGVHTIMQLDIPREVQDELYEVVPLLLDSQRAVDRIAESRGLYD